MGTILAMAAAQGEDMLSFLRGAFPNWFSIALSLIGISGFSVASVFGTVDIIGDIQVGPPIFAALLLLSACWLVNLHRHRIAGLRPSVRFRRLYPEIKAVHEEMRRVYNPEVLADPESANLVFMEEEALSQACDLKASLRQLDIPTPVEDFDKNDWHHYLSKLRPLAKVGALDKARGLNSSITIFEVELED